MIRQGAIFTILIFYIFSFQIINACQCPPPKVLSSDRLKNYSAIFSGKVIRTGVCDKIAKAVFRIDELNKGTLIKEIEIEYDCTSACMMHFSAGEEWIIYGKQIRPDLISVDVCSESRLRVKKREDDLHLLLSGKTYDDEIMWLRKNAGLLPFFDSKPQLLHSNEKPDIQQVVLLICISALTLLLIYFIFKKWLQ
jgi:hypothetical protein